MFYLHTVSASALKSCKTYSSITIILYIPISYGVVGCLDWKQEKFHHDFFCTPPQRENSVNLVQELLVQDLSSWQQSKQ